MNKGFSFIIDSVSNHPSNYLNKDKKTLIINYVILQLIAKPWIDNIIVYRSKSICNTYAKINTVFSCQFS